VATYPIGPDGVPVGRGDLVAHQGRGRDPQRQEGPHAHSSTPTPDGLLVADLGVDTVYRYRVDPATGALTDGTPVLRLPAGSGPRHLVHTGQNVHVVGELSGTLNSFARVDGAWQEAGSEATSVVEGGLPSEVDIRGRWLYVANRGPDTIAVFDTASGRPVRVGEVSTGGSWPRHFVIVDRFLYLANERSSTVVTFALDPATGLPVPTGDVLPTPSPTCILPWGDPSEADPR
jgi:6-phosphogluconolactonase (cycloisomerase 2 family)